MSRPRKAEEGIRIHFSLPASLVAELNLLTFDPVRGKPAYGQRTKLFTMLLREYLNKKKKEQQNGN